MANKNYIRGRNFEYKRKKELTADKYHVIRAAGSHGMFDLVAIPSDSHRRHIILIQCKVVETEAEAKRMLEEWKKSPPLKVNTSYDQELDVWVSSTRQFMKAIM